LLMFGSTVLGGGHGYAGIMTEEREHDGGLDTVGSMRATVRERTSKTTRSPRASAAAKEMRRWFEGDQRPGQVWAT
jgi:hypothetical protein